MNPQLELLEKAVGLLEVIAASLSRMEKAMGVKPPETVGTLFEVRASDKLSDKLRV